ncbi:MAG: ATP-binding protein [Cryomorphaceae bacterium]|nr:ATP-binding protein [Cryomorphaceae bacterium]
MIVRQIQLDVHQKFFQGKAIIILGPRQVGKTTLLKQLVIDHDTALWLNGDDYDVQQIFNEQVSALRIQALLGEKKILVIDEAQRIKDVGLKLKRITDSLTDVQLIATGSSAFELLNSLNEPLTGRKWEYRLFPFSFKEMVNHHGLLEEKRQLLHRLVYGYYPEIVNFPGQELERLKLLTDSYLYKDILTWDGIQKPDRITKLLQALAFQVGSQVSYNELAQLCSMDSKTVEKYILLLEKCFVIFRIGSFSRNLRNELKTSKKIYFVDNGVRNALIANFSPAEMRQDIGALWENFLMSERYKQNEYGSVFKNNYFWRLKSKQEIDFIEESDGQISAFEFKWNTKKAVRCPLAFRNAYPNAEFSVITPENVEEFIL